MSRNFLVIAFSITGLIAGALFFAQQNSAKSTLVSSNSHNHHEIAFPKQKPHRQLTVEVTYSGGNLESGDTFDLTGSIFSKINLVGATYKWVIDEDLDIVSGNVIGHLDQISEGDTETVSITLRARAKKAMKVFLHVYSDDGKFRIGSSGYFNTKNHMSGLASTIKSKPVKKIPVSRIIY